MARYLLTISYIGSAFCGWQVQPNGYTVQRALCDACEKIFGKTVNITGCSRTDSGVNATEFCCHTDLSTDMPCEKIVKALNANLPDTVAVKDCKKVSDDFHARYDCKGKNYVYKIVNSAVKDPFSVNRALFVTKPLDVAAMQKAAAQFVGTHDFSAFCAAGSSVKDKVRTVTECSVEKSGNSVIISVTANGFLYNMVRIIAGTLIEVGKGEKDYRDILGIINSGNRENAGYTAPPYALYLNKVYY